MTRTAMIRRTSALWLAWLPAVALPQVVRDGTIGPGVSLQPVGPAYVIPQAMGELAGSNLFHSFAEFSLARDQSATFLGRSQIDNVIARVTGSNASFIDGLLRSQIPGADLWLVNPRGVMFGPNASLDLTGSLNLSTANSLDFDDGTALRAQAAPPPVLSVAAPTAFRMLGGAPGRIEVNGALLRNPAGFSLRSGVIEIGGGGALAASASTSSRGGDIDLLASDRIALIDSPGMVGGQDLGTLDSRTFGSKDAGDIRLEAPVVELDDGGSVRSVTAGSGRGGDVFILASEQFTLGTSPTPGASTEVMVVTSSTGAGGNLYIDTPSLLAKDAARLWTLSNGPGAGGDIIIDAGRIEAEESSEINSVTMGSGRGGDVFVTAAEEIFLGGHSNEIETSFGSTIGARSTDDATRTGHGGSVTIEAPVIVMVDGGRIDTVALGAGDGGDVLIEADSITVSGRDLFVSFIAAASLGRGNAGNLVLHTGRLLLENGGTIGSDAFDSGRGGDIEIVATESVTVHGNGGEGMRDPGAGALYSGGIAANARLDGAAGSIEITAPSVTLTNGGAITSSTTGSANGGTILITADELSLDGTVTNDRAITQIRADSGVAPDGQQASGNAGRITLIVRNLEISDGASISSSSVNVGDAGSIRIEADGIVRLAGESTITTESQGAGAAGEITLAADTLELSDGARISSSSLGTGNAGAVRVDARGSVLITDQSAITTEANNGNAGEITLTADSLELSDGARISSSSLGTGNAGAVNVDARDGVLITDQSAVTTEASNGNAGEITLTADSLELSDGARISSSSLGTGNAGAVHVDARDGVLITDQSAITTEASNGNAGEITLTADSLELSDGARISSSSLGAGDAGDIHLDAGDGILITDESAVTTEARGASGNAGDITLAAGTLELSDGARISSSSLGTGDAGDIRISARHTMYIDGGTIATEARQASGGNISISAGDELTIRNGEISTSVMSGTGSGGNITIGADLDNGISSPNMVLLDHGRIIAAADAGSGGHIEISSTVFLASGTSTVDASATRGIDGRVSILAGGVAGEPRVENLAVSYMDAASLLRGQCVARDSRFVVRSRRGQPASPEEMLLAFDAVDRSVTPDVEQFASASEPGSLLDGELMLRGGRDEDAAVLFRGAADTALSAGDTAVQADALRGLGQSLQAQGLYVDSLVPLHSALAIAEGIDDRGRASAALVNLGNAQLALGNDAAAGDLLTRAVVLAQQVDDAPLLATAVNAIGNKYVSTSDFEAALASFEESAALARRAGDPYLALRALANAARVALHAEMPDRAWELMEEARASVYALPATAEKVQLLVHVGRSQGELARASGELREQSLLAAFESLSTAEALARSLPDQQRALSFALGNLAALYEQEQRVPEALYLNAQAQAAADEAGATDAAYRWDWQEGRLRWARGEPDAAIKAYRRAVDLLGETRQAGQARYGATSGYFREAIAPAYLDLVDALLRASDMLEDPSQIELLLEEARQTMEQLKAAELRDYFRDECAGGWQDVFKSHWPATAVVYPIVLADRLELLVSLPNGIERHRVAVSSVELTREVRTFRQQLEERSSPRHYRPTAKRLYDWLVAPYAASLAAAGVETLVFVPDGALRSMPMSALYDGEDFIVARYATVTAASLALVDLQPLPTSRHALLVGLSESVAGFPGLPNVPDELGSIRAAYGGRLLLNADFTRAGFESAMADRQPAIVHIASHGQFTGDPATSFLLTHDGALSMSELERSVSARNIPLEMLVLSACETAAGDDRAALGLAGVGLRAGARSAVGSLWNVSDAATAVLFEDFYGRLHEPGTSRAAAMRAAQRELLDSDRFSHPFFWSGFLLINSWL